MGFIPQNSVVLINGGDCDSFGTGFIIYQDRPKTFLVTCAHVVNQIEEEVGKEGLKANNLSAKIVASGEIDGADLAVLEVTESLNLEPFSIGIHGGISTQFKTAGYYQYGNKILKEPLCVELSREASLFSSEHGDIKAWHIGITDEDKFLNFGYSGSPVFDEKTKTVIGVISCRRNEGEKGFAISLDVLNKIWPAMPQRLIEDAIWRKNRSSIQLAKGKKIQDALARTRESRAQITPSLRRSKISRNTFVKFNLGEMMKTFNKCLGYDSICSGIFEFSIGGDYGVLNKYLIERFLLELEDRTKRPLRRMNDLHIYLEGMSDGSHSIEQELIAQEEYGCLADIFDYDPLLDTVLIIWNHNIPKAQMEIAAESFRIGIKSPKTLEQLTRLRRLFVIIWANVGSRPLKSPNVLKVPNKFNMDTLSNWFKDLLETLRYESKIELEDSQIDNYVSRLEKHHGYLLGTYREMEDIMLGLREVPDD